MPRRSNGARDRGAICIQLCLDFIHYAALGFGGTNERNSFKGLFLVFISDDYFLGWMLGILWLTEMRID